MRPCALVALLLGLGVMSVSGCRKESAKQEERPTAPAPHFELKDISGKTIRLSDFKGKVVLLDFWATYCLPCHEAIPIFQGLYKKYGPRDFEVVGISVDVLTEYVPDFVQEHGMGYTVLLDPENSVQESYKVYALPTTFLIDQQGTIRKQWAGFEQTIVQEIEAGIVDLLKEKH